MSEIVLIPMPEPAELTPTLCVPPSPSKRQSKPKSKPRGRRSRVMGPPFRVILYGQSGRKLDVTLEAPAEGEECPLTLAPIADDTLEFLQPTTTWFVSFPDVKKAVLPCGHSFGALNILYHFARRNMLCPCCRAGHDTRLAFRCIPPLFRNLMEARILRELRTDTDELVESDRRAASGLQAEAASLVYVMDARFLDMVMSGSLSLDIRFTSYNEQRPPLATLNVPLLAHVNHDDMSHGVFTLPRGSISDFIGYQLRDPSVCGVDFTVVVDDVYSDNIRAASSSNSPIMLDRQINRAVHVINAEGGSTFTVEFMEGHCRISSFEWRVPTSYLSSLRSAA